MPPEIELNGSGENPDNNDSPQLLGVGEGGEDRSVADPGRISQGAGGEASNFSEVNLDAEINAQAAQYVGFDPEIHATNADGTPRTKKDGSFALKRGRKPANALPSGEPVLPAAEIGTAPIVQKDASKKTNYKALGKVYAGLFIGGTSSIIGPEWQPQNKEELINLENAFTVYAESTGAQDLPPGLALVMTVAAYSAARFQHENTRNKFGFLKDKFKVAFLWLKNKVF